MYYNLTQRNRDFTAAAVRIAKSKEPRRYTLDEIVAEAIDGGAPAYYISFETAVRRTRELRMKGKTRLKGERGRAREQWEDFFIDLEKLRAARPDLPNTALIARVLSGSHPRSFYLTIARGKAIIREQIRHRLDELPYGLSALEALGHLR